MNRKRHPTIIILLTTITLAIIGITQPSLADTLCVHPTGGSGCYTTIQAAVDAASDGDIINIAQGTYTDTDTNVIEIENDLSLYGGWSSDFSQRDPQTYLTTIDGQDHAVGIKAVTPGTDVTLDGLKFINGYGRAGGVEVDAVSSITIVNCTFSNNHGTDGGGAIRINDAAIEIANNTISYNTAGYMGDGGGGIYLEGGCSGSIHGNTISNNTAQGNGAGGGLYLYNIHNVTIYGNTITNNYGNASSGGLHLSSSSATISGNTISGNSVQEGGTGSAVNLLRSPATLTANTITGNYNCEGTIYIDRTSGAILNRNTITSNPCDGGVYLAESSSVTLNNNVIANNDNVGVYVVGSDAQFRHNTIADNDNRGLYVGQSGPTYSTANLVNTILSGHTTGLNVASGNTINLDATLWSGNGSDTGGSGTINRTNDVFGDPDFVAPGTGDYHLGPNSDAIDTGVDAGIITDIDGDPRPQGNGYDIGADESPAPISVSINEVLYDPGGSDTGQEIVELYNHGADPADLTGYDLKADNASYYTMPPFVLSPGAYVAIHINAQGTDNATHLYAGLSSNMGNTNGYVALFDSTTHSANTMADYLEYGAGGQSWESAAVSAGLWTSSDYAPDVDEADSLNLQPDGDDNDAGSDWSACYPSTASANCQGPPPTDTPTPTRIPTSTPTPTSTPVSNATPTDTPAPTSTPTVTPGGPTFTPTPTNTATPTPTSTPTPTPTNTPTPISVSINEVLYDPDGADTGYEIVELYNYGTVAVNLTGYDLKADDASYYTLPSFTLNPGSFVAVHVNTEGTDTFTHLYAGASSGMGNTSGYVVLFDSDTHSGGTIVDYLEYGAGGQSWESTAASVGLWTAGDYTPDVEQL